MSRRARRELQSRLRVLVCHLLKWQAQPARRSASWSSTIRDQRREIARCLEDAPSLRPLLDEILDRTYAAARRDAAMETGIAVAILPGRCPYSIEETLSPSYLPEPPIA